MYGKCDFSRALALNLARLKPHFQIVGGHHCCRSVSESLAGRAILQMDQAAFAQLGSVSAVANTIACTGVLGGMPCR